MGGIKAISLAELMGATKAPEPTTREKIEDSIRYHERRLADMKEALGLLDAMGDDKVQRLVNIISDKGRQEIEPVLGPHGPGCECPSEDADDDETKH